jgi:dephospho-CoA kinase
MDRVAIGVAGYMAAGKSVAAQWLAEQGARVVDADAEAKRFMNDSADIRRKLVSSFGDDVVRGEQIDSAKLGAISFNSFANLLQLNGIVHVPLQKHFEQLLHADTSPLIVMDAALIPMWRVEAWFDVVYWIEASAGVRLERLKQKSALPEDELCRRMDLQGRLFPPPVRPQWRRIANEGTMAAFQGQLANELAWVTSGGPPPKKK